MIAFEPIVQALSVTVTLLGIRKSVSVSDCHYPMILSIRSFFGPKNCHCSWVVMITSGTVIDRVCNYISGAKAFIVTPLGTGSFASKVYVVPASSVASLHRTARRNWRR